MAEVRFEHVTKSYSMGTNVISDLNLVVKDGEFLVLVGPSGCGKSTALRMIAGLEAITEGDLFIGNRRVNEIAPKDRDIAMVFQNYALYPHMTVFDNLAFSLKLRHVKMQEIEQHVQKATQMLGIGQYLRRHPRELSGGQRQRVALGRALVRDPQVFLLDEPLSNLDAKLRVQTRAEISRLHQATGTTFVYVTHDQVEAMTMGDRIAVLNEGVIQQLGTPQELYDAPNNLFVASFIGSPAMDFFHGYLMQKDGRVMIAVGDGSEPKYLSLTGETATRLAHIATTAGNPVTIGIRPEDVRLAASGETETIDGTVEVVEHLGNELLIYLRIPGLISTEDMHSQLAIARLPPTTLIRVGQAVALAFDTSKIHIFDPSTTRRI